MTNIKTAILACAPNTMIKKRMRSNNQKLQQQQQQQQQQQMETEAVIKIQSALRGKLCRMDYYMIRLQNVLDRVVQDISVQKQALRERNQELKDIYKNAFVYIREEEKKEFEKYQSTLKQQTKDLIHNLRNSNQTLREEIVELHTNIQEENNKLVTLTTNAKNTTTTTTTNDNALQETNDQLQKEIRTLQESIKQMEDAEEHNQRYVQDRILFQKTVKDIVRKVHENCPADTTNENDEMELIHEVNALVFNCQNNIDDNRKRLFRQMQMQQQKNDQQSHITIECHHDDNDMSSISASTYYYEEVSPYQPPKVTKRAITATAAAATTTTNKKKLSPIQEQKQKVTTQTDSHVQKQPDTLPTTLTKKQQQQIKGATASPKKTTTSPKKTTTSPKNTTASPKKTTTSPKKTTTSPKRKAKISKPIVHVKVDANGFFEDAEDDVSKYDWGKHLASTTTKKQQQPETLNNTTTTTKNVIKKSLDTHNARPEPQQVQQQQRQVASQKENTKVKYNVIEIDTNYFAVDSDDISTIGLDGPMIKKILQPSSMTLDLDAAMEVTKEKKSKKKKSSKKDKDKKSKSKKKKSKSKDKTKTEPQPIHASNYYHPYYNYDQHYQNSNSFYANRYYSAPGPNNLLSYDRNMHVPNRLYNSNYYSNLYYSAPGPNNLHPIVRGATREIVSNLSSSNWNRDEEDYRYNNYYNNNVGYSYYYNRRYDDVSQQQQRRRSSNEYGYESDPTYSRRDTNRYDDHRTFQKKKDPYYYSERQEQKSSRRRDEYYSDNDDHRRRRRDQQRSRSHSSDREHRRTVKKYSSRDDSILYYGKKGEHKKTRKNNDSHYSSKYFDMIYNRRNRKETVRQ